MLQHHPIPGHYHPGTFHSRLQSAGSRHPAPSSRMIRTE
jgi:hypothetical protein